MRKLITWVFSIAKRFVDDSIAEADLHAYIGTYLNGLEQSLKDGTIPVNHEDLSSLLSAAERLKQLAFPGISALQLPAPRLPNNGQKEERTTVGAVVQGGKLNRDAIAQLSAAVMQERSLSTDEFDQLNVLLRRVEVKRQDALQFEVSLPREERWRAVARVSILFARFTQREQDYRFLNASLKLNDWAFGYYRNRGITPGSLPYMIAVLEAEACLRELPG